MLNSIVQIRKDNFSNRKTLNTIDNKPSEIYRMMPIPPIESLNEINEISQSPLKPMVDMVTYLQRHDQKDILRAKHKVQKL